MLTLSHFAGGVTLVESPVNTNTSLINFPTFIKGLKVKILYLLGLSPVDEIFQVASLIRRTRNGSPIRRAIRWPACLTYHNLFAREGRFDPFISFIQGWYSSIDG